MRATLSPWAPLLLGDRAHERAEFEVKRPRGQADIHAVEHFHSSARQSTRLGEQGKEKELPVGAPAAIRQSAQDTAAEANTLISD